MDNQLFILNGRTLGDLTGQFTCHTPKGSSTVDYIIASRTMSNCIHSMRVHDLSIFSDHCMISTKIKLFHESSCNYEEANVKNGDLSLIHAPDRFEWSEMSKTHYQQAFASQVIQDKLSQEELDLSNGTDSDYIINSISDIIVSAGNMTLKRKSYRVKHTKPRKINKKWYDRDCQVLLREVKMAKNKI